MAAGVPPPPINSPAGSYYWLEWYTNLTNFLNGTNIPWSNLNFTGSNILDIQQRSHQNLQNLQGGNTTNRYHLLGCGLVDSTGGAVQMPPVPAVWTSSRTGVGTYVVTHNLGVSLTNFMCAATSTTAAVLVQYITFTANTFTVHTTNAAGTAADGGFSFVCTAVS